MKDALEQEKRVMNSINPGQSTLLTEVERIGIRNMTAMPAGVGMITQEQID
jgi:hypothetical protein